MHEQYYVELAKQEKLLSRKNEKSDFYNGVFDRYVNPVLTRDMIPLTWRYDLNPETNPYFMERLGINAVMNSGAIYLNGKYYLVARIEEMIGSLSSALRRVITESTISVSGIIRSFLTMYVRRRRTSMICD